MTLTRPFKAVGSLRSLAFRSAQCITGSGGLLPTVDYMRRLWERSRMKTHILDALSLGGDEGNGVGGWLEWSRVVGAGTGGKGH
jgi:hypothetical protein